MVRPPTISRSSEEQAKLTVRLQMPSNGVWGYVRVSSDGQEDGQSPEVQEQDIIAYAAAHGLAAPTIVREIASAGKPMLPVSLPGTKHVDAVTTAPRPLLLMLIGHLIENTKQHLIVWKLDRLARVQYEQEMLLELMRRRGVTIHSTQLAEQQLVTGDDGDVVDPTRVLFRQIMGSFAQYERAVIQLRMSAGLRMKASKGGWVGGHPAYGYRPERGDLVIVPDEAVVVRRIFYLRDECSLSLRRIVSVLQDQYGLTDWHKIRVSRVVHNRDLYNGVYIDPYGNRHPRPDLRVLPPTWTDYVEADQQPLPVEKPEGMPAYGEEQ